MRALLCIRNEPHDQLGISVECFERAGASVGVLDAFDDRASWPALDDVDGLAVYGGPMNVDQVEQHPYLLRERRYVREAVVDRGLPFLGLCLGGQMLARALEAPVTPSPVVEVGFVPVHLTDEGRSDPIVSALPDGAEVFQWHTDTFALPEGGTHLARGDRVAMQAFRWGARAWALQFHPEVNEEELAVWIADDGPQFEDRWGRSADGFRREIRERLPDAQEWAGDLLSRFGSLVAAG